MKKTIWILLLTFVFSGISFAQLPGADKKEKKSELTAKIGRAHV